MNLNHRVVVITGASSGIGEATAHHAAAKGARLVLAARRADKLEALAQELGDGGTQALVVPTDVTDVGQVQALIDAAIEHYGQIDVLVNNAGFGIFESPLQGDATNLKAMMEVNLYGAVHAMQAVLPHMLERRQGQIVNVASVAGLVTVSNMASYNASKFALVGFSRSLQMSLDGSGVQCAIICPGPVRTPFLSRQT
ncbi:MAG: SDR family NAD(P)-dependent oxidoreductase [Chloroflexaceae bacterium]|nr:SDR family NAD(P)-dependent oxidoreductase [Chloroflexaceae bacterium]